MAAEDRARLKELLLPAATAVLGSRPFDLVLDEAGIALDLAGTRTPIASAQEIRDGTFGEAFTKRLADAAGIEARDPPTPRPPPLPAHDIPIPWKINEVHEPKPRPQKPDRPHRPQAVAALPPLILSRMPPPKWVTEAAEMTGTVDTHNPESHPVCGPPRMTRRAQMILDEIEARHRE